MALVSCEERKNRSSTLTKEESAYTRTFRVITDDQDDGPQVVRSYLASSKGIAYGVAYASGFDLDITSRVKSINCNQVSDDGLHWDVVCSYGKFDTDSTSTSPLDEPPEISWDYQQFESPLDVDADGTAVLNSAGDPFAESLVRDDSRPILSISRNQLNFDAGLAWQYRDSVNADPFQGAPKKTVKCSRISGKRVPDADLGFYWVVNYEFHFNADGWTRKILDRGFRELDDEGEKIQILKKGKPISDPENLDGDGHVLPKDEEPVFLEFEPYPELPFSVFGF